MAFLPVNGGDRQSPIETARPRPKLLVIELWGIGDLTFATPFLAAAANRFDITLLAKPHARPLLSETFPELKFIAWDAPWTAFTGKYRLWRWSWKQVISVIAALRRGQPDVAVSVRDDPRDHFLMWLAGAHRRVGFPIRGSQLFLSDSINRPRGSRHKVEDWRELASALGLEVAKSWRPTLSIGRPARADPPRICIHVGARIHVRRWPLPNFAEIIRRLRRTSQWHVTVVPDPDGYGAELEPLADVFASHLDLQALIKLLAASDAVICNDSAPGHLAAAVDTPVLALFGPSDPVRYRPWGENHHVIIRDLCPHRPCFDYCRFPEPFCMTQLSPEIAWPEIERFLSQALKGRL